MLEKRTVSQCTSSEYCRGWNDAVDEMPKWIDVKERLPERDDYYLCAVRDDFVYPFVVIKYFCNGEFDITDWYKENCGRKVTHWMPLPEPPKEKKDFKG